MGGHGTHRVPRGRGAFGGSADEGASSSQVTSALEQVMPASGVLFSRDSEDEGAAADDDGRGGSDFSLSMSASVSSMSTTPLSEDDASALSETSDNLEPTDRYGFYLSSLKPSIELPPAVRPPPTSRRHISEILPLPRRAPSTSRMCPSHMASCGWFRRSAAAA